MTNDGTEHVAIVQKLSFEFLVGQNTYARSMVQTSRSKSPSPISQNLIIWGGAQSEPSQDYGKTEAFWTRWSQRADTVVNLWSTMRTLKELGDWEHDPLTNKAPGRLGHSHIAVRQSESHLLGGLACIIKALSFVLPLADSQLTLRSRESRQRETSHSHSQLSCKPIAMLASSSSGVNDVWRLLTFASKIRLINDCGRMW